MKVYKYQAEILEENIAIEMPIGAEVLCVDWQGDKLTFWALVYPENALETRYFRIVGTGQEVSEFGSTYVGTCFHRKLSADFPNGFVWHVFER